jgi:hypothetical protein
MGGGSETPKEKKDTFTMVKVKLRLLLLVVMTLNVIVVWFLVILLHNVCCYPNFDPCFDNFFKIIKKIKIYMWREHRASGLRKQYIKEIITESYIITAIS